MKARPLLAPTEPELCHSPLPPQCGAFSKPVSSSENVNKKQGNISRWEARTLSPEKRHELGWLSGGGRDLAEQALPEPRWREAEWTVPLSQSIQVWSGESPPHTHPARGWGWGSGSSPPVCARPGVPTAAGMGSPGSGPSAPSHRSRACVWQSRSQGPAPSVYLSRGSSNQLVSGGLGGTPSTGHFRREAGAVAATDLPLRGSKQCMGI